MKKLWHFLAALVVANTVFPAGSDRSRFIAEANAAKAEFEQHGNERHQWKQGQVLPESLAEAGLLSDATLIWSDQYLDGGTKGFLFKDSAGNYLAVCTGPGFQSKDHPQRIDAPLGSRLFIGGLHYTKEAVEMVPADSKAEAWLRNLIEESKG